MTTISNIVLILLLGFGQWITLHQAQTQYPTGQPSQQPTMDPSCQPTQQPTNKPSQLPSSHPTQQPSLQPTMLPTSIPSNLPSSQPSLQPTTIPSIPPSQQPSARPSISQSPTTGETEQPTRNPTPPHWSLSSSLKFYISDVNSVDSVLANAHNNVYNFLVPSFCDSNASPSCTCTVGNAISSTETLAPTMAPTVFDESLYIPAVALHHIYKFNGSVFYAMNGGVGVLPVQDGYYTSYSNYICFGSDLTSYSSKFTTPTSCQRFCDATVGCVGFIYGSCPTGNTCYDANYMQYSNNACWLKTSIDIATCTYSDPSTSYYGTVAVYSKPDSHPIVQDTLFASSTLTISMSITTTQSNVALMSLGCSTSPGAVQGAFFVLYIDDSGHIGFGESTDTLGFGLYGSGTKIVNNGRRTHVAFVKSGSDGTNYGSVGKFYVNGTYAGTLNSFLKTAIPTYNDVQLVLGYEYCGLFGGIPFNGTMQDVMMFPSAFNALQVNKMSKVHLLFSENNITFDGTSPETYMQGLPTSMDSSDMTLSMWINPTSPWISGIYGDKCLMSLGYKSSADNYFDWKVSNYQFLEYFESSITTSYSSYLGAMVDYSNYIDWGVPTHVAMVKRGNTGIFYINGQMSYTYTPSTPASGLNITNQNFVIGGCPSDYNLAGITNNFIGRMDTIRIFQGAMEKWQLDWLVDPSLYVHDSNDLTMLNTRFVLTHNSLLGRRKTMAATIAKTPAMRAMDDPNEEIILSAKNMNVENVRTNGNPTAVLRSQRGLQSTDNTVEVSFSFSYAGVSTAPDAVSSYIPSLATSFAQYLQYNPNVLGGNVVAIVFPLTNVVVPSAMPTQEPTPSLPPSPPLPYMNLCGMLMERQQLQNCSQYNYVVDTVAGAVPTTIFVPDYPASNDDSNGNHPAGMNVVTLHQGSKGDGGNAERAFFGVINDVVADPSRNNTIFILDSGNNKIRTVNITSGVVNTLSLSYSLAAAATNDVVAGATVAGPPTVQPTHEAHHDDYLAHSTSYGAAAGIPSIQPTRTKPTFLPTAKPLISPYPTRAPSPSASLVSSLTCWASQVVSNTQTYLTDDFNNHQKTNSYSYSYSSLFYNETNRPSAYVCAAYCVSCGISDPGIDSACDDYELSLNVKVARYMLMPATTAVTLLKNTGVNGYRYYTNSYTCPQDYCNAPPLSCLSADLSRPGGIDINVRTSGKTTTRNLYVADTHNHVIRKINVQSLVLGIMSNIAGNGLASVDYLVDSGDKGSATLARLSYPTAVFYQASTNYVYIVDRGNYNADRGNSIIRVVKPAASGQPAKIYQICGVVYGNSYQAPSWPQPASTMVFQYLIGITGDTSGNIYISDQSLGAVFKLYGTGTSISQRISSIAAGKGAVTIVAGGYGNLNNPVFSDQSLLATSSTLSGPGGVRCLPNGNLLIVDTYNNRVRYVDVATNNAPNMITVVGTVNAIDPTTGNAIMSGGYNGDGKDPLQTQLNSPQGIFADSIGDLYIADTDNYIVRKVHTPLHGVPSFPPTLAPTHQPTSSPTFFEPFISTIAGNGLTGYDYTGLRTYRVNNYSWVLGKEATLNGPSSISADANCTFGFTLVCKDFYFSDTGSNRIMSLNFDTGGGLMRVFAGVGGKKGYGGDGGPATLAIFNGPSSVVADVFTNVYIADANNNVIRWVPAGSNIIHTFAGNARAPGGYFGDCKNTTSTQWTNKKCVASKARFNNPQAVTVDTSGNLYISDSENFVIRYVARNNNNTITTIIGTPHKKGYDGEWVLGTLAKMSACASLVVDRGGNLYIADTQNDVIRFMYSLSDPIRPGIVFTLLQSSISTFTTIATPYVASARRQLTETHPTTIDLQSDDHMGKGGGTMTDDAMHQPPSLNTPTRLPTVLLPGTVINGVGPNGPVSATSFGAYPFQPRGVNIDSSNNLYIADTGNAQILKFQVTWGWDSKQCNKFGLKCCPGDNKCSQPGQGLGGTFFYSDNPQSYYGGFFDDITKEVTKTQMINNGKNEAALNAYLAVHGCPCTRTTPVLSKLHKRATDPKTKQKYEVSKVVAGNGVQGYNGDDIVTGPKAELNFPQGMVIDGKGNVYIADTGNNRIRAVYKTAYPTSMPTPLPTIAPTPKFNDHKCIVAVQYQPDPLNAPDQQLTLNTPQDVRPLPNGNLLVADTGNNRILLFTSVAEVITTNMSTSINQRGSKPISRLNVMSASGAVMTVLAGASSTARNNLVCASTGCTLSDLGDGGIATNAFLDTPGGVCADNLGNIFIADTNNNLIRVILAGSKNITTYAGTGAGAGQLTGSYSEPNDAPGNALLAGLFAPNGVAVDSQGTVFFTDANNFVVRVIIRGNNWWYKFLGSQTIKTVAGIAQSSGFSDGYNVDPAYPNRPAATFNTPTGIAVDGNDNVYVADSFNNAIRKITLNKDYSTAKVITIIGLLPTTAGTADIAGYGGDGVPTNQAILNGPQSVWVDPIGNVYFADTTNNFVRMMSNTTRKYTTLTKYGKTNVTSSWVTRVAGQNGTEVPKWNHCAQEGGYPAADTPLNAPAAVCVDFLGNIIIADSNNNAIQVVYNNYYPTAEPTSEPTLGTGAPSSEPTIKPTRYPTRLPVSVAPTLAKVVAPLFSYIITVAKTNDRGKYTSPCTTPDVIVKAKGGSTSLPAYTKNGVTITAMNSFSNVTCPSVRAAWYYCLTKIDVNVKAPPALPTTGTVPVRCEIRLVNTTAPYQFRDFGNKNIAKLGAFLFYTPLNSLSPTNATATSNYNAGSTAIFKLQSATIAFMGPSPTKVATISGDRSGINFMDVTGDKNNFLLFNLEFRNLRFTNIGTKSVGAGLISLKSLSCVISDVQFGPGIRGGQGGALFANTGVYLTIKRSIFTGNLALTAGGAVFVKSSQNVVIQDTQFLQNYVNGSGGAVAFSSYNVARTKATFTNCVFIGNVANKNGGAISGIKSNNIYVSRSVFTNNQAQADGGGAIYMSQSNNVFLTTSVFGANNVYPPAGGSTFTNPSGGALYMTQVNSVTIGSCTFANNTATGNGGAIMQSLCTGLGITNSSFDANVALHNGGAMMSINSVQITILNSAFLANSAIKFSTKGLVSGGALCFTGALGSKVQMTNNSFVWNTASSYGGAVIVTGGFMNAVMQYNTFTSNVAWLSGGALSLSQKAANIQITNNDFYNNTAWGNGGAIQMDTVSNVYMYEDNFYYNNCTAPNWGQGGAISASWVTVMPVSQCIFVGNTAAYQGGAVWLEQNEPAPTMSFINFTSCLFDNNLAGYNAIQAEHKSHNAGGGAVFASGRGNAGDWLLFDNCQFNNNTCLQGDGGALWANYSDTFLYTSNFSDNTATQGNGGAVSFLYLTGMTPIHGNRFVRNTAGLNGGGLSLYGSSNFDVRSTWFLDNTAARNGGAVDAIIMTLISFTKTIVKRNKANNGGGFSFDNLCMGVSFVLVFIIDNEATSPPPLPGDIGGDGGGMYFGAGTEQVSLYACSITGNKANRDGGGIFFLSGSSKIHIGGFLPYSVFLSYSTTPHNGSYPIHTMPYSNGAANIVGYYIIFDPTTNIDDLVQDKGHVGNTPQLQHLLDGNGALDTTSWPGNQNNKRPFYSPGNNIQWYFEIYSHRGLINFVLFPTGANVGVNGPECAGEYRFTWYLCSGNGTTIYNNFAGRNGGGLYFGQDIKYTVIARNTIIDHNVAIGSGGGMYTGRQCFEVYVMQSIFSNNTAKTGNGGGVALGSLNYPVSFYESSFAENSAFGDGYGSGGSGGGIYATNGNGNAIDEKITVEALLFENCAFSANYAGNNGGMMYLAVLNAATFRNLQVYNNYAFFNGGGLYVDTLNFIEFYNVVFVGNGARVHGGGVATGPENTLWFHNYTAFYNNFAGDAAPGYPISFGSGGAVHMTTRSVLTIVNGIAEFVSNKCNLEGGALSVSDGRLFVLNEALFQDNDAGNSSHSFGGAIILGAGVFRLGNKNITFSNNRAADGSALHLRTSTAASIIIDASNNSVLFEYNHCYTKGGTISWIKDPPSLKADCERTKTCVNPNNTNAVSESVPNYNRFVFIENYASFGNTTATQSTQLVPTSPVLHLVSFGVVVPNPQLQLIDFFGHLNNTDDTSSVIVRVHESHCEFRGLLNYASIQGATLAFFKKGIATFDALTTFCWPGGNVTMQYTASISGLSNAYNLVAYQTYVYRFCRDGEILVGTACVVCGNGTYSLHFTWDGGCTPCPPMSVNCYGNIIDVVPDAWRISPNVVSLLTCPIPGSCIGGVPNDAAFADDDYAVANGAIRHTAMPSYEPSYAPSKKPTARHRTHAGVEVSTAAAPVRPIATLHRTPSIDYNSETSSSVGFAHPDRIYPPWARRLTMSALPFSDSSLENWESYINYDWEEGEGIVATTILERIVSFLNPYAWAPPKRSRRQLQAVDTSTFGCAYAYWGPLCSLCKPKFYFDGSSKSCKSCKGQGTSQLILLIIVPCLVILLVCVATFWTLTQDPKDMVLPSPDAFGDEGDEEEGEDEEEKARIQEEMERMEEAQKEEEANKKFEFFREPPPKSWWPWGKTAVVDRGPVNAPVTPLGASSSMAAGDGNAMAVCGKEIAGIESGGSGAGGSAFGRMFNWLPWSGTTAAAPPTETMAIPDDETIAIAGADKRRRKVLETEANGKQPQAAVEMGMDEKKKKKRKTLQAVVQQGEVVERSGDGGPRDIDRKVSPIRLRAVEGTPGEGKEAEEKEDQNTLSMYLMAPLSLIPWPSSTNNDGTIAKGGGKGAIYHDVEKGDDTEGEKQQKQLKVGKDRKKEVEEKEEGDKEKGNKGAQNNGERKSEEESKDEAKLRAEVKGTIVSRAARMMSMFSLSRIVEEKKEGERRGTEQENLEREDGKEDENGKEEGNMEGKEDEEGGEEVDKKPRTMLQKLKKRLQTEDGEPEDLEALADRLVGALSNGEINLATYRMAKRYAKGSLLKKLVEKERERAYKIMKRKERREAEKNMTWGEYFKSKVNLKDLMPKIKILAGVFQIVGSLPATLGISFGGGAGSIFSIFGIVNFGGVSFGSPQCYAAYDYVDSMMSTSLLPIGVLSFLYMGYIFHMFMLARSRTNPSYVQDVTGQYINFFFLITFLVLPSVSTKLFGAFACTDIDPDKLVPGTPTYLTNDMSIACTGPNNHRYIFGVFWAIAGIIVYPFGVLFFYYYTLNYNKADIISAHLLTDGEEAKGEGEEKKEVGEGIGGKKDVEEAYANGPTPSVGKSEEAGVKGGRGTDVTEPQNNFNSDRFNDPNAFELDGEGWQVDRTVTEPRVRWDTQELPEGQRNDDFYAQDINIREFHWNEPEAVVENREAADYERIMKQRKGLMKYITVKELEFLHKNYMGAAWYWEVVETIRKLLLTAGASIISPGSNEQVVFMIVIALIFIKLYAYCQPFINYEDDVLQEMSQYQIFFTLFIALLIKGSFLVGDLYSTILSIALILINLSTLVATAMFTLKVTELLEARKMYAIKKVAQKNAEEAARKMRIAEEKAANTLPRYQDAVAAGTAMRERMFRQSLWRNEWPDTDPVPDTLLGPMNRRQRDMYSIELPFPREFEHYDGDAGTLNDPTRYSPTHPSSGGTNRMATAGREGNSQSGSSFWPTLKLWEAASSSDGNSVFPDWGGRSTRRRNSSSSVNTHGNYRGTNDVHQQEERGGWTDTLGRYTSFKL